MATRDHFISRGWLEEFANKEHKLFTYNLKHRFIKGPYSCREVGFENDFWSFDIDAMLAMDELGGTNDFARWIDSIIFKICKQNIPITELTPGQRKEVSRYFDNWRGKNYEDVQIPLLREFIAIARKVQGTFVPIQNATEQLARFIVDEYCWGFSLREEIKKNMSQPTNDELLKNPELSKKVCHNLWLFTQIEKYICNTEFKEKAVTKLCACPWIIIRNKTDHPFVISDRPIAIKRFIGERPQLQLIPICKDIVIQLGFGENRIKDYFSVADIGDLDLIQSMNTQIALQSCNQVFCGNRDELESLEMILTKEDCRSKAHFWSTLHDLGII